MAHTAQVRTKFPVHYGSTNRLEGDPVLNAFREVCPPMRNLLIPPNAKRDRLNGLRGGGVLRALALLRRLDRAKGAS